MAGFFTVTDVPARRVVQYKRVAHSGDDVVYVSDEGILGDPINEMPYADKTGLAVTSGYFGMVYEVPYLEDAGDVYFATQPEDSEAGATLTAAAKAGTGPYSYQWYKDDKQVVNVPDGGASLKASEPGKYWVVVTDAAGGSAVSRAATVE
jgi:Penicillin-Binding Protein C-terminus Family.